MKGDVPSCRYCYQGWILYATDSEGDAFSLRRPVACDCAGGKVRQTTGAASWRQVFYRRHWHRIDKNDGNRIVNARRQEALRKALKVEPIAMEDQP